MQHCNICICLFDSCFFLSGRNGLPALSHGFFNSVMLWRAGPQGLVILKRYLEISLTEQSYSVTKCTLHKMVHKMFSCLFSNKDCKSLMSGGKTIIAMLSVVIYWKFPWVSTGSLSCKIVRNVWLIHYI